MTSDIAAGAATDAIADQERAGGSDRPAAGADATPDVASVSHASHATRCQELTCHGGGQEGGDELRRDDQSRHSHLGPHGPPDGPFQHAHGPRRYSHSFRSHVILMSFDFIAIENNHRNS